MGSYLFFRFLLASSIVCEKKAAMHADGYVAVGIWTSVMPDITF